MGKPAIRTGMPKGQGRGGGRSRRRCAVLASCLALTLAITALGGAFTVAAAPASPPTCPPTGTPAATGSPSTLTQPLQSLGGQLASPSATTSTPAACASPAVMQATATPVPTKAPAAAVTPTSAAAQTELAPVLPPPDIPAANQQGYAFKLKAELQVGFNNVPNQAPVYQLQRTPMSATDGQALADRLKIGGKVQNRGNGSFVAEGSGGQLFITPDLIQYITPTKGQTGAFPADDTVLSIAREWLRQSGMVPPDIGSGSVVSKSESTGRIVVQFGPVEPDNLLSGYPSVMLTLDAKGNVLQVTSRWALIVRGDLYQLRPPAQAWALVKSGQAYIEVNLPASDYPSGSEIDGTVSYTDISIGYTTAGPPGGQQYLEPVFIFSGQVKPNGAKRSFPLKAYIAALASSNAPVG